jgi:hypothetical protein
VVFRPFTSICMEILRSSCSVVHGTLPLGCRPYNARA